MNKKIVLRYILLCFPFVVGSILFSFKIFNLLSSLLFFVGGYVAIKNIFDYRKVKKNKDLININSSTSVSANRNRSYDSIPGLKRTRRYHRVRKRIKY